MIALFKQKSPGNVGVLLIFGLLLKLPIFLYPRAVITTENDGKLYQWLISEFSAGSAGNTILWSVVSFLLLYVQSLMINFLVTEYRMVTRQNYLPAMAYLIITSLLPEWSYLSAPLVSNTFIIWMFIKLFRLYNAPNAKAKVYNIGLIAGISSYIYFPSSLFIVCILLGLIILKPFRINEIALFIVGSLTPYYFYAVYLFLVNRLSIPAFFPHISVKVPLIKSTIWLACATLLLAVPFLIGGYFVQTHLRKMLIQVRKNWSILLLYLVLAFFVPFINGGQTFYSWVLLTAPFAAFHACAYFYQRKGFISLILFFVSVGFVLYLQYGTQAWR